jgi:predicted ATPase
VVCHSFASWALAQQGQTEEGIEQMPQGMMAWRAAGAELGRSAILTFLAEAYGTMEQPEVGLTVLAEALVHVEHPGGRYYEAEIHRLEGVRLLQQNSHNHIEAENCFHLAAARQTPGSL